MNDMKSEKEYAPAHAQDTNASILTGLSNEEVQMYLENAECVLPDEEAQGSVFTVITLIAMC